jgi:hypothetical protein
MAKRKATVSDLVAAQHQPSASDRMYRAQNALDTIMRAQEFQRDKALMRDVKKYAADQVKTIQQTVGRVRGK